MSDLITEEIRIKGKAENFVSTMTFLLRKHEGMTVSPDYGRGNAVKVTPSGSQPPYRYCRFEAIDWYDGSCMVQYFTPAKSEMGGIIEEVMDALRRAGLVIEDGANQIGELPATSEIPKSDQAEPPRPGEDGKTWDDVFSWYYQNRAACPTLRDLAKMIVFAYGHVRREHAKWKAQHM